MERLKAILLSLLDFWTGLSLGKRVALVGSMVAVLLGVMAIALIGQHISYAPLYAEMPPEDAAAVVEKLKAQQIPFQLEGNGTKILVPEERIPALRLELASAGIPRGGGVGFEIFDRTQIGATEFEQQVNLRRALEGELARSIMTLEGVKTARVHLVLPERRLFVTQQGSAQASVVLGLKNAHAFGKSEVAGIVHLVASAVPGLSSERVSVVSTEGLTLHRPNSDASGGGVGNDMNLEQSQAVATQLEGRAREQLERVVGPGNADVRISVDLDTSTRERSEEYYNPKTISLRSEHVVEEYLGGGPRETVAGVPGARSNLPDAPGGEGTPETTVPGATGGSPRHTHTRNFEVDRFTEKTSLPAGSVKRLNAAVLLNGHYETKGGKHQFVPRSKEEVAELEAVVKRAIGYDAERGDGLEVQAAKFVADEEGDVVPEGGFSLKKRWPYIAAGAGALLLAVIFGAMMLRGKKKKPLPAGARKALPQPIPTIPLPAPEPEPPMIENTNLRDRALELAGKDPATAAVVIRKWLNAPSSGGPSLSRS